MVTVVVEKLSRPRIKPEHRPYRTVDGNVRIGSVIYGIGAEIADPEGWVWSLMETMDGSRDPAGVVAEVLARQAPGADLNGADVEQAIADLLAAGFVEDAGAAIPLPERERERYSRSVSLLRWMDLGPRPNPWDAQLGLRKARVLLLGVGGTGGFAAHALVASGVGHVHCVEPDVVELSNLNRQPLYREPDIGQPKVEAALETLRTLNSDVRVTGERREVRSEAELAELISGKGQQRYEGQHEIGAGDLPEPDGNTRRSPYDLLVLAADQPRDIRWWVNRACLAASLPWVEAGYRGPLVTAGAFVPGLGPCWECLRAGEVDRRDLRLAPDQDEDVASPRMPWNPANAVTAGLSGSLLAHAALALLTGVPAIEPGFRFGVNLMVLGDPFLERFPQRPDCPACGQSR